MSTPDAVRPLHLSRLAIVYVRQSSPHQTLVNQESLRLQYDLREHALTAGWESHRLHVIDSDLGQTGRTAQGRRGFQELVTLVNQEQVGILFAYDVTRLARNCTDWYQLLDLCGLRHCLVGDQDGIYDPATPTGRMILGLKGLIAELELHTLRSRLTAGLLRKAQRGELTQILPIGLVRDTLGQVSKHPDQEVQTRLSLVFATFLHLKSAPHVVRHFNAHDLLLPRRGYDGDLVWRRPTGPAVLSILKNPAYAGAFVYGRTRVVPHANDPHKRVHKLLPIEEWKICLKDKYPAYIDWGTFTQIQAMIRDNYSDYDRDQTRGVPRPGKALLQGIVCCGECGHKIVVQYKGRPRYVCNYLQQKYGVPTCQNLPADTIDAYVIQAFFDVLSPAELDLYDKAVSALRQDDEKMQQARQQHLERLRYQTRLAERQFNQADPDNRLVTAELEKRWEAALRELKEAEERFQREQQQPLSEGAPNPAQIVQHKHIGEGRRAFTHAFRQALRDAGLPVHRRNVEVLARGLIDHVRLTEEMDHWNPDDVVPYTRLEQHWRPRPEAVLHPPKRVLGMYLEKPVLHYTIGTRIRPSVVKELDQHGVGHVLAHHEPPPFEPIMVRGLENLSQDQDWMTRFLGSYLEKGLLRGAHRGDVSDEEGTSYVPSLARGTGFGQHGLTSSPTS